MSEYLVQPLLESIKDSRTPVLKECICRAAGDGGGCGRADFFVRIEGQWIPVEVKLRVELAEGLLAQVRKYLGVRFFRATQGREEELVEYDTPETRVCLVVDGFGVWLVGEGGFIVGDLDEPGWMRTEFRADTLSQIRAALVRHAGRKRARRER